MNPILKWLATLFLEKGFKSLVVMASDYFKKKELEKKTREEIARRNKIAADNKRRLDQAISKGDLDEIKQASENYINFIESH